MVYLQIIRPINCSITFISVLVGAWIGRGIHLDVHLAAAAFIGFAVCAFGNVMNDLKDIEIDRINNPKRPLPSGRIESSAAWGMAIVFLISATVGSLLLGLLPFLIVMTALALLVLYSTTLKKTPAGNITVSATAALSFIFGGIVAGNIACLIPALFSLLIHMPREIVKDVIDMSGDRTARARTLPIVAGPVVAYNVSALFMGFLCLLLPLPYIVGILKIPYIVIILAAAYPLLFYTIYRLLTKPPAHALPLISNLIKASMAVGLLAMIVS
ncbi:MAG: geranylgeranylglycerol-phosphate geranylgeranyltransferase [candidate division WOR-3 bacterium]|nr:MAG: geranylgeranylglycerol-phosphate geranylgeranyltransferase [candidate division WOR-3 bacterium]